jgi:hypothetical protein
MSGATFTGRAQDFRSTMEAPFLEKPVDIERLLGLLEPRP